MTFMQRGVKQKRKRENISMSALLFVVWTFPGVAKAQAETQVLKTEAAGALPDENHIRNARSAVSGWRNRSPNSPSLITRYMEFIFV
jgi:hypothetical protein